MTIQKISHPPLGWNSFDSYSCHIYEDICMRELKVFAEKYRPHGYEFFVIDNGWFSEQELDEVDGLKLPHRQHSDPKDVVINEYGIPQPSNCFFPNGFKIIVDFCKAHDIKFGVHLMRGIPRKAVEQNTLIKGTENRASDIADVRDICGFCTYMYGVDMSKTGAQEYYNSVFEQFAEWGVDFVKVDDVSHSPAEIEAYVKAIENVSRPMILSLSPGGTSNKRYLDAYRKAHMIRTTVDIWDNQYSLDIAFNAWDSWQGLESEDFYPDLDMIPFGELCILRRPENFDSTAKAGFAGKKMHHICSFTEAQKETFITQRAMSASPLMIGGSLQTMDTHSVKLLTDKHMLDCVKNGVSGHNMNKRSHDIRVYISPEKKLNKSGVQEYRGVDSGWLGVFNCTDKVQQLSLNHWELGFKVGPDNTDIDSFTLTDIWRGGELTVNPGETLDTEIAPNGVAFYRFNKIINHG